MGENKEQSLMEALNVCVALDRRLLGAGEKVPSSEELAQFVDAHKRLADAFQDSDGDEIRLMDIDSTQKLQLENERQLMPVFISQSEFGLITYMTTFSCFWMSEEDGEPMHSAVYMRNAKRLHEFVNIYFGRDPSEARGC